jgi:hypothetical protein
MFSMKSEIGPRADQYKTYQFDLMIYTKKVSGIHFI